MAGQTAYLHTFERDPSACLSGWKEIAVYLGKGVRTVQRYETDLALPVRRPAGKTWGSVIATKAELDAWVKAAPIREAFTILKPAPAPSTDDIRKKMAVMASLCEQMQALRSEVNAGVRSLRESVQNLKAELNANQWRDPDFRRPQVFDASDFKTGQRKAS